MAQRHTSLIAVLACSCLLTAGCDPVRTTLQPVLLRVTNSISGEPVAGAQVAVKYDYDRAEPLAQMTLQPAESWHQHMKEFWDEFPWSLGVTGRDGDTGVEIKYTVLDRTIGPEPPSWRDKVSGKPHLVKVEADQEHEEFSLVMRPGESARGQTFTVCVLEIRQPRYVKTE